MPDRLSPVKGFVRMSWAPANLYNLFRLSYEPPSHIRDKLSFKRTSLTMFQQKWSSKRLLRAYHGDFIKERKFRRRFLPNGLPALEAASASSSARSASTLPDSSNPSTASTSRIPLASLMWREVEARLDVLVFRACFAHSVYEARRLVTQGHVKLNGRVVRGILSGRRLSDVSPRQMLTMHSILSPVCHPQTTDPNILLEPGDLYSVTPKEMYLLRPSDRPFSVQKGKSAGDEQADDAEAGEGEGVDVAQAESSESAEEAVIAKEEGAGAGRDATSPAGGAEGSTADVSTQASADESSASSAPEATPAPSSSSPSKKNRPTAGARKQAELPGLPFTLPDYAAPFIFIPAYLEVSFATCSAVYVRHPTARPGYSEIPSPYEADGEVMRLGWEFYKGVGRRRRNVDDWGDAPSSSSSSLSGAAGRTLSTRSQGVQGTASASASAAAAKVKHVGAGAQYDAKGRRMWTADWDELKEEQRRTRAVRNGRGRWAHRPV